MQKTYGVVWREGDRLAHGKLEFLPRDVLLEGLGDSEHRVRTVPYRDIVGVTIGRTLRERLHGMPTVILELREGHPIRITSVGQSSPVGEIAERLARAQLAPANDS